MSSLLLLIFLTVFFIRPVETEDIWWHLKAGEFIAAHKFVPSVDPFPFSSETQSPWRLTQWLGSLFYYIIFSHFDIQGLIISRVLIFLSIFLIFFRYAYKKITLIFLLYLIFLLTFPFGLRSLLRPFVFNLIFIQILLILLWRHQQTGEKRILLILPLVGIMWSNIHLGSLVYSTAIFISFLLAYLIKFSDPSLRPADKGDSAGKFKTLLCVFVVYLSSFAIGPYGWEGLFYPIKIFLFPDLIHFYTFNSIMSENYSPIYILHLQGAWFWILSTITILILAKAPRQYLTSTFLFVIALGMFLYSQRGADFFAIVCGYIITQGAHQMDFQRKWSAQNKHETLLYICLSLVLLLNILHTTNKNCFLHHQRRKQIFLREDLISPLSAVALIKELKIKGNIFNWDAYGGYLLWSAYPQLKPFVDGRQLSQALWNEYLQTLKDPALFWSQLENKYQLKIILLDTHFPVNQKLFYYIAKQPSWQLIDVSGYTVLFVKRDAFDLPQAIARRETEWKSKAINHQEIASFLARQPQKGRPNILQSFIFPSPDYIDLTEGGITLFELGYTAAGIDQVYQALQLTHSKSARDLLEKMLVPYP